MKEIAVGPRRYIAQSGSYASDSAKPIKGAGEVVKESLTDTDVVIDVPLGTVVMADNGTVLKDLNFSNEYFMVARFVLSVCRLEPCYCHLP